MQTITLQSVYGKVGQIYYMQAVKDPKTGQYPSCVKRVTSQGDMILTDEERNSGRYFIPETQVFQITSGTSFNLSDPVEKAQWQAIENHPWIAQDRFARDENGNLKVDGTTKGSAKDIRYGKAELYVSIEGKDAEINNSKVKRRHKAQSYVLSEETQIDKLRTKAKVLGRPMNYAHPSDVVDYLIKECETNPEKIIALYEGDDMKHRLLLSEAIDKKIIVVKNGLYIYGDGTALGASDSAVVNFFKDSRNKLLVDMITREVDPEMFPNIDDLTAQNTKGGKSSKSKAEQTEQ